MSPEQRLVLEPPYHTRLNRPALEVDGEPAAAGPTR